VVSPPSRQEFWCPTCGGIFAVHLFYSDSPGEPHRAGRCPRCGVAGTLPTGSPPPPAPPATFVSATRPPGAGELDLALSSVCGGCGVFLVDREPACRGCGAARAPLPAAPRVIPAGNTQPRAGGAFAALPPAAEAVALLDDRLRICLPAGAALSRRRVGGLMGMQISQRREHHAWMGTTAQWGPARALVVALDPFEALAGPVEARAESLRRSISRSTGCRCGVEPAADGGRLMVPERLDQPRTDILVAHAIVPHPDGTLLHANFITDRATAQREPAEVLAFARELAATLRPGPRSLALARRRQRFGLTLEARDPGQPGALSIDLAEGFVWDADEGHDFLVHTFQQVVPEGTSGLQFKIYLGAHPSPRHSRPPPGAVVTAAEGSVLSLPVSWRVVAVDGLWEQETLVRLPLGDGEAVLHAFSTTDTEQDAAAVRAAVGTIAAAPT
jgi:hypothetical protein